MKHIIGPAHNLQPRQIGVKQQSQTYEENITGLMQESSKVSKNEEQKRKQFCYIVKTHMDDLARDAEKARRGTTVKYIYLAHVYI